MLTRTGHARTRTRTRLQGHKDLTYENQDKDLNFVMESLRTRTRINITGIYTGSATPHPKGGECLRPHMFGSPIPCYLDRPNLVWKQCGEELFQQGQARAIYPNSGAIAPPPILTSYMRPHGMTHSKKILLGNQTT